MRDILNVQFVHIVDPVSRWDYVLRTSSNARGSAIGRRLLGLTVVASHLLVKFQTAGSSADL